MFVQVLLSMIGLAPWPVGSETSPLVERLVVPEGFARVPVAEKSFGSWLRQLPVKPGRPEVRLFDGRKKRRQDAQFVVLDIDVGDRDLQQCADAVMRLFSEWQWSTEQRDEICFRFTSGDELAWSKWEAGDRPRVRGNNVSFVRSAAIDRGYRNFRKYLESVFTYAGTFSLQRDLLSVSKQEILPGDVFIQGGFPGHAVLVVDVVENRAGDRMFALAQSYMPAQEIHVLANPTSDGPWYRATTAGKLETPEWTFEWSERMRFGGSACPSR